MQMRLSTRSTVLAICLSSSLAVAKEGSGTFEALTGKVLPGRCASTSCTWFTIENSELEGIGQHGELFQLKVKWWTSKRPLQNSIPPLTLSGQSQLYVFCSKTNPTNITRTADGKAWKALLLAPEQKNAIQKDTETAIALYWGACHRATEANVYKSGTQLGQRLGYEVKYPFAEGDEKILSTPADVLKW
jgi:hypothetical protein